MTNSCRSLCYGMAPPYRSFHLILNLFYTSSFALISLIMISELITWRVSVCMCWVY